MHRMQGEKKRLKMKLPQKRGQIEPEDIKSLLSEGLNEEVAVRKNLESFLASLENDDANDSKAKKDTIRDALNGKPTSFLTTLVMDRLTDPEGGFVKKFLKHARSKFEVFNSKQVKEAANFIKYCPQELWDGYPLIDYLIWTTVLLASTFDSDAMVASGLLLHDPLRDREPDYSRLKKNFGNEVADLVRDVSKLSKPSGISGEGEQQNSEHTQDSILNTVQDVRAVMIKIALRTVQMILLDKFNPKRKQSLVKETLDLYVPLLERLGFSLWKSELEYLCASVSEHELMRLYNSVSKYDLDGIAFSVKFEDVARKENLKVLKVEFHKRALHSIRNKMSRKNSTFSEIRDIIRLRITVATELQCYKAKEVVEKLWKAVPKFEKDYIKDPKRNGYRSLHVLVKNAKDQYMKVQIYSRIMRILLRPALQFWAYDNKDVHVPLENLKLLIEFASRVEFTEKSELWVGSVHDLLSIAGVKYKVFESQLVKEAARFAIRTQKEKVLLDGYPVIVHLIFTAIYLAGSFNSDIMVASGLLLYGSLGGAKPEYKQLKKEFEKEVAKLVRDVSKLSKLSEIGRKEQLKNANLLPDLILAMGVDPRAVAIKIAECIVQMTVRDKLKQEEKGFMDEILRVYVPLSERLGFSSWKSELENLCKIAEDNVKELYASVSEKDKDDIPFKYKLEQALKMENFPYVRVEFRKKSLLSILKKMSKKEENDILKIEDILGLRIIIEDEEPNEAKNDQGKQDAKEVVRERCDQAKGVVAKLWEVENVKDYINAPKVDGYKSLHVIVKNPNNHFMEVQIRTNEMHNKFDDGHWLYKEGKLVPEHVKMLVEMARFSINQAIKIPVYVLVEDENKVTKIEERPIGMQLTDLFLERNLEPSLWEQVLVNEVRATQNYTLKMGDIIKLPILPESDSSHSK